MSQSLFFVDLKDLKSWSVAGYISNLIHSKYKIVEISSPSP